MSARLRLCAALGALLVLAAFGTAEAADIYVPGDYGTIQAAIDAAVSGDTIYVGAGTYPEQLKIDGKDLDLVGAGIGSSIIEAVDLVDRTTYGITQWSGSSRTIDPIVGVVGPCTVNISGFTVDGRELGESEFYGIHYFDVSGSITECRIEDVLDAAHPGAQSVVSVAATHSSDPGSYSIEFSDNEIPGFQKVGFLAMGPKYTFTVEDNVITNAPTEYNAGNGMQLSYGATGSTARNDVSGVAYEGEDWSATGILLMESGDVDMVDDVVHDCETGISFSDWHWVYVNPAPVNVTATGLDLYENAWAFVTHLAEDDCDLNLTMSGCSFHDNTGDGLDLWCDGEDPWGGGYYTGWNNGDLNVDIDDCAFLNTTGYDGIWATDDSGNPNNVDCDISGTSFSGNNEAAIWNDMTHTFVAENCYWGDPSGPTVLRGSSDTRPGTAPAAPFGETLPEQGQVRTRESLFTRAGDGIHGPVDYEPYLTGNIVCVPDPEYLTESEPTKSIEVKYLGGGSAPLYGYSLRFAWDGSVVSTSTAQVTEGPILTDLGTTFFWKQPGTNEITIDSALLGDLEGATGPGTLFTVDFTGLAVGTSDIDITVLNARDRYNDDLTGVTEDDGFLIVDVQDPTVADVLIENLTLAHTDDYIKDTDAARVTATVTDDDPGFDESNITADLTGLGGGAAVNPDSYAGNVATWTTAISSVTCTPSDGTVTVTVSAVDDQGNAAAPDSDTIVSDNIAPTAISGFTAAPSHNEAVLAWDDPTATDVNFYEVHIQSNAWGDYPTYTGGGPAYPADQDDGTDVWEGTGTAYTAPYDADGLERDIYYYQAFASDMVLHYGPADAGARDRCTNYWLGDVAAAMGEWGSDPLTPFNGLVNDADIDKLGGTYFVTSPAWPDNQCDVGPTDDDSRVGIPDPDDFVGFEDLMIFAMNYGVVNPRVVPLLPDSGGAGALELALEERSVGDDGTVEIALVLRGNSGQVKGLSAVLESGESGLGLVEASLSRDLSSPLAPVFFWSGEEQGRVHLDLAVLGTGVTIGGSGDVCYLTFRTEGGDYALDFAETSLRGAENEQLDAELEGLDSKPGVPVAFRLVENTPNPFNPKTTVRYHVPSEAHVSICVYDISGRRVRVLADGATEPGRHEVVWDGRDARGEEVGSGVYFCVMQSDEFRASQKMILLK
ncbi:MAG: T9SS type A sorting domain-containing protein [Candidatus Eisenbacteria bacterium]|nr:T9SS type A sorting domain-containing protein [Candidatus Eisenbacteria bacterium]